MSNDITTNGGRMDFNDYVNSLSDNETVKSNCKLCNSKLRKEAELRAERGENIASILRFLMTSGEDISYGAVNNHINYHYKTKQSESDLKEYATQLERWGQMSMADDSLIRKYVKMLDIEITYLGAKNAQLDITERRKNDEVVMKMQAQVMSLKEQAKKLHAELQPIEIMFMSLNRIIEMKLKSSISIDAKRALQDVIDQLKKEVGEVPIEGKKSEE